MTGKKARVRFAPSPTGFLHVGGARTALINWLFARSQDGVFILRIEDTDRARSTDEMTRGILDGLAWLELDWDEGPHHQAEGAPRHRRDALQLLDDGKAYRCFCTVEEARARGGYRYDGRCRELPAAASRKRAEQGTPWALRFQVPAGRIVFDDMVHGETAVESSEIEDFVLLRSDGSPTYQMSCVSDDVDMDVTHVIRGDDHLSNTPKQILLYQALERPLPRFGHLPLIFGPDRKKLSKRHGAISVTEYRDSGFLADALFNYLALLGWSPGDDRELMTREELIAAFSADRLSKSNAIFDTQKLEWMNGQKVAAMSAAALFDLVRAELSARGEWDSRWEQERRDWFCGLLELLKSRARTVAGLAASLGPYVSDAFDYDPAAVAKHLKGDDLAERLAALRQALAAEDGWEADLLEQALRSTAESLGVGAGKLIHPARVALTGQGVSPGLFEVMVQLGRERTLARLQRLEAHLGQGLNPTAG